MTEILDPVMAYDRIAAVYPSLSAERASYHRKIEELIAARVPPGSRSLLDVGAGDGSRPARIALAAGLTEIVLLEPSNEMIKPASNTGVVWPIRVEELPSSEAKNRRFDVITCLWNVLGHICDEQMRIQVLTQLGSMLGPEGRLFLDLNHRYNVRSYGFLTTIARFFHDRLLPRASNGDVLVTWRVGNDSCRTYGHVFTDREIRRLVSAAKLAIEERAIVDYDAGKLRRFGYQGNFLYVLRRASSSKDSPSASQTRCTPSAAS